MSAVQGPRNSAAGLQSLIGGAMMPGRVPHGAPASTADPIREQRNPASEIERLAETFAGGTDIDNLAIVLMRTWGRVDPRSSVAMYPTSYVATFADMARAVVAEVAAAEQRGAKRALREAASAARGMHDPVAPDCAEWADWLDARADAGGSRG